jgi:indolepyruvate ferredoxin oxidoreductase
MLMTLHDVALDDKFDLGKERIFLSGAQAVIRLPMMQRQRDAAAGLDTGGFISGYRGSPLGGYDAALWQASRFLKNNHIHFQPGVNEDLAATAIWGTQQVNLWPGAKHDGVFAIWYGKGPGVDRSGDAFKHANSLPALPSTAACWRWRATTMAASRRPCRTRASRPSSRPRFRCCNPAGVQEYIDYGLYGFALSRFSGCWVGFKAVGETVESSATVSIDPIAHPGPSCRRISSRRPMGSTSATRTRRSAQEERGCCASSCRRRRRSRAPTGSTASSGFGGERARLGIISTGKAYLDVRQALDDLGIDEPAAAALGIRLYKVALHLAARAAGHARLRPRPGRDLGGRGEAPDRRGSAQAAALQHGRADAPRVVVGKTDEEGRPLLPDEGELTPGMVAQAIVGAAASRIADRPEFEQRLARMEQIERQAKGSPPKLARTPYFCSGCPHNTSTKMPEGSRAMAGIGCHGMALWMPNRNTQTITHMGGEGVKLDRAGAVHQRDSTSSRISATAPITIPA